MGQAAVNVADDGVAEVHQTLGDAALAHGKAGKGVQGNGQQRKAVHALKHTLGDGNGAAAAQKQDAADGGQAQAHGNGHTQEQQYEKGNQQPGNHSLSPPSGFSVSSTIRLTTAPMMQITPAMGKMVYTWPMVN